MSHVLFLLLVTALRAQPGGSPQPCEVQGLLFFLILFLLIFDCAGSLLLGLCGLFSSCSEQGLLSHCGGFSHG